jgi:manganese/zinc/iron transport system permease protein
MVLLGGIILGTIAGMLGAFVLIRQQSLLSDAIAHASLPGIVVVFLFTGSVNPSLLMIGGIIVGSGGIILMYIILYCTKLKKDAVLGIILSVFFGIGLVLLTLVQKQQLSDQSILNKYLFGNITTMLYNDVLRMILFSFCIIVCVLLIKKELTMVAFDREYTQVQGYSIGILEGILYFLLVVTIGIGLHMVGVILISTMIISPAIAARQYVIRMTPFIIVSGMFGALAAVIGIIISSIIPHMPTGPCIVLVSSSIAIFSLLITYKREYAKLL